MFFKKNEQQEAFAAIPSGTRVLLSSAVVFYALHVGSVFFLPVITALVLSFLLAAPFQLLTKLKLPPSIAAAIVVTALTATIGAGLFAMAQPLEKWVDRMPEAASSIKTSTKEMKRTLSQLTRTAEQLETLRDEIVGESPKQKSVTVVVDKKSAAKSTVISIAEGAVSVMLTLMLLYFCLAGGSRFTRKLIMTHADRERRRRTIRVIRALRDQISHYLLTITIINVVFGCVATAALYAYGIPDAWVWGALAGITNFVPYIGTVVTFSAITFVSSFEAHSLLPLLIPGMTVLALNGVETLIATPSILGARLSLNPVFILLSLIFWGALWGIAGMLLAVPILAATKVVLENWNENTAKVANLIGK